MTAVDKRDSLLSAASSISDGDTVDWHELRRRIPCAEDSAVLDQLRVLDGIAQVHRTRSAARGPRSRMARLAAAINPTKEQ